METSVKLATDTLKAELETKHKYETELKEHIVKGELKLKDQIISNLNLKIKEQESLITQLTKKSDDASSKVQEIAVKAVESSTKVRFVADNDKRENNN